MKNNNQVQEIPVYMFLGFLESGKTTFASETLIERGFTEGEPTLLLVFEEGIEEYDVDYLKSQNIHVEFLEEENLNTDYLLDLQDKYKPTRVMIEYNGTWTMDKLFGIRVPKGWTIVQVITFVNAETYDVYMANMKSIIYDQAVLEGVSTTFPDTELIIENGKVNNVSTEDVLKIINLKHLR